jgi:sugar lactone lactonase YvrE
MRRAEIIVASLLFMFLALNSHPAEAAKGIAGQVRQVLVMRPLIDTPEGIVVDDQGNIFVSNNRLENDKRVAEILRIALDGTVSVFATLDPALKDEFGTGLFGLAIDTNGDLYAALASFRPGTRGVWRIRPDGEATRLPGSRQMIQPNAIAFDPDGYIYVTDSAEGTIWRFRKGERGRLWIRHPLLAPDPEFGIGANGIVFVPPRNLFVANTDLALIARVRIRPNGEPAVPELVALGDELLTIDGLAADVQGNLHAVIAGASIFGTSPLVKVNPVTGKITSSTNQAGQFDFPTSLAFGRGPRDHESVFVVNSGIFAVERGEAAPGVIRARLGVAGTGGGHGGPGQLGFNDFFGQFYGITEEGGMVRAYVHRANGSQGAVSVSYRTGNGSATAGKDFALTSGTLHWADGDTQAKQIAVQTLEDSAAEGDERFLIQLSNPTGGVTFEQIFGAPNDHRMAIIGDDDAAAGRGDGARE